MKIDMHLHTNYSDGGQTVKELVQNLKEKNVEYAVLCDHDCLGGIREFLRLCRENNIMATSGIEISAYSGDLKVHILGYNIELDSKVSRGIFGNLIDGSKIRAIEILKKLKDASINISLKDVLNEKAHDNSPIHAMHICASAVKKGYAKTKGEFYKNYLLPSKIAYSNACRPTPEQAIDYIHSMGGRAVIAHPGRIELDKSSREKLILSLVSYGIDGIEVYYKTHTSEDVAEFLAIAKKYNLWITCGSDNHSLTDFREVGIDYE